ncbi:enoyl-[acyl-carrier-protein] reductase, mitochondrial [Tanacetum coccineum]
MNGPPDTVTKSLVELPPVEIKANDVCVKMLASLINPADINRIEGVYPMRPPMSLQEKVEQVTVVSRATFVAREKSLNDKNSSYVAPILIDILVKVLNTVSRATCRPGYFG